mgnify:CR=1 FL=1
MKVVTIKLYTLPELRKTFEAKGYEDHERYLQNNKCEMRDALKKARGYYDSFKCDAQRDAYLFTITGDRVHRDSIIEEFSFGYFDDHDGNRNPLYEDE